MGPRSEKASGRGQASVELVAVLPALAVCLVIAGQTVAVGWALWSAGNAARAGARAEEVGSNAEAAARHALPGALRDGAVIHSDDGFALTSRTAPVPALAPGLRGSLLSA